MTTALTIAELEQSGERELGTSEWHAIDQERINLFAEATGDHQWIHVDVERAKKEMPAGKTIAHGYLTLSLIPMLNHQISHINNVRNGINYGCNKVRFTSPVPAGSRVRARAKLGPEQQPRNQKKPLLRLLPSIGTGWRC